MFAVALGVVDGLEVAEHLLVGLGAFVVEDLVVGEAVAAFERVAAGTGLAFGSAGSGGVLRVAAVALGNAQIDVVLGFGLDVEVRH